MKKIVSRVGIKSLMRIYGFIGLVIGLVVGIFLAGAVAISGLGVIGMGGQDATAGGLMLILIAIGLFLGSALGYGIISALGGMITGLLYNLVTRFTGGIEIQLEEIHEKN